MFSGRAWEGSNPANPTTGNQGVLLAVGGVVLGLLRKGGGWTQVPATSGEQTIYRIKGRRWWQQYHHGVIAPSIPNPAYGISRIKNRKSTCLVIHGTHSPLDLQGAGGSPRLTSDLAGRRKSRSWKSRGKISGMLTCSQWFFKKSSKQFSSWSWSIARSYCTDVFKHLN